MTLPVACRRLVTALLMMAALAAAPLEAQQLTIRFFNVGQGDAALITSPEGKTALIDGGRGRGENAGLASLALFQLHVERPDLVVASHNHEDHIGGLDDILRSDTVRFYMDNGLPMPTDTYDSLLSKLKAHKINYSVATPATIPFGSATLRILPFPPHDTSQNNSSVGVLLTYRGFTALFTGDAEGKERKVWEAQGNLPHVSVLKVAHHGAENGTDSRWLQAIQPRVAVISVGARNGYHHPSPKTLHALDAIGATVYRTDRQGDITVVVDSLGGFAVRTDSTPAPRSWPPVSAVHH